MDSDNSVDSLEKHDSLWKKIVNLIFTAASDCVRFCGSNSALMLKDPRNREEGTECSFVAYVTHFYRGKITGFIAQAYQNVMEVKKTQALN